MDRTARIIATLCLRSRLELTLLAIGSDLLLPDHEADAFKNGEILDLYKENSTYNHSVFDQAIITFTGPFIKWDAQYFLTIAQQNSYAEESLFAFFPLYPLVIRNLALLLQFLLAAINVAFLPLLALSAYLVNLFCFVLAGIVLFKLTAFVFNSAQVAYEIVNFFAYNPASIFFTAFYTESMFSLLTFSALYCLYRHKSPYVASILFGVSSAVRSNGITSVGFILYFQAVNFLSEQQSTTRLSLLGRILHLIRFVLLTTLCSINVFLPFILFQLYAFNQLCSESHQPEWCHYSIPLSYSAIQATYWNVGFLRYFQLKQIPNFLLATPILALVFWSTIAYLKRIIPQVWQYLGVNAKILVSNQTGRPQSLFGNKICLPFAIHSLFLATVCFTCMHVQVGNRFLLSSSPWPYWAMYHLVNSEFLGPQTELYLRIWLTFYFIFGTLLFANFLPFT